MKKDGDTVTVKVELQHIDAEVGDVATVKSDEPINVSLTDGKPSKPISRRGTGGFRWPRRRSRSQKVVTLRNDAEQKIYEDFCTGLLDLWTISTASISPAPRATHRPLRSPRPLTLFAPPTLPTTAYFNSIRSSAAYQWSELADSGGVRGGSALQSQPTKKVFANIFNDYEYANSRHSSARGYRRRRRLHLVSRNQPPSVRHRLEP